MKLYVNSLNVLLSKVVSKPVWHTYHTHIYTIWLFPAFCGDLSNKIQQDLFFTIFPIWFSLILLNFFTSCFLYFMVSIYSFAFFSDHFPFLRIPPPESFDQFWGLSSWNPIYKPPIFQSFFKVFLIMAFSASALLTFGADNFLL